MIIENSQLHKKSLNFGIMYSLIVRGRRETKVIQDKRLISAWPDKQRRSLWTSDNLNQSVCCDSHKWLLFSGRGGTGWTESPWPSRTTWTTWTRYQHPGCKWTDCLRLIQTEYWGMWRLRKIFFLHVLIEVTLTKLYQNKALNVVWVFNKASVSSSAPAQWYRWCFQFLRDFWSSWTCCKCLNSLCGRKWSLPWQQNDFAWLY